MASETKAAVHTCPRCGRPETTSILSGCQRRATRKSRDELDCNERQIRQLQADLAAAQQLGVAERDLVTATMRWRDYDETHDPKDPGWTTAPFVGFLQAIGRYRLALRAAAGKPDAG